MRYITVLFLFLISCRTEEMCSCFNYGDLAFIEFSGEKSHIALFEMEGYPGANHISVQYDCINGTVSQICHNHKSPNPCPFDYHWSWYLIGDKLQADILSRCEAFAPVGSIWKIKGDTLMIWQSDEDFIWVIKNSDSLVFDRSDFFLSVAKKGGKL